MADTNTAILELLLQETGGNDGTWGTKLNNQVTQYLEDKITGITSISTTGGDTTLTAAQARANLIKVTGTLVSNANIIVPNEAHSWYVWNATTNGGFAVGIQTSGGTGAQIASIPPNCIRKVLCDAADGVYRTDQEMIGSVLMLAPGLASSPSGTFEIVKNTSPTAVSRTTLYRDIFRIYGTTYGAGDGSTTFVLPHADQTPADSMNWAASPSDESRYFMRL